jgi:hypothetical protein
LFTPIDSPAADRRADTSNLMGPMGPIPQAETHGQHSAERAALAAWICAAEVAKPSGHPLSNRGSTRDLSPVRLCLPWEILATRAAQPGEGLSTMVDSS